MGVQCLKCPLDMWIYQEIIAEIQPDLIIETGTHIGGSALFMAHMLDIVGHGENYHDRYPRSCW
jgi:cephalosporin hydroxylase